MVAPWRFPRVRSILRSSLVRSSLVGALAERPGLAGFTPDLGAVSAFALQVIRNRPAQVGIGDVMRRVGGLRQVSARQLMLALGAGFHRFQAALDGKVDRLVIADLEMQERMVLDRAPVAAEQRVRSDEIDGAGD